MRVLDIFPSESAFFSIVTYMFGLATHFEWHSFLGIEKVQPPESFPALSTLIQP